MRIIVIAVISFTFKCVLCCAHLIDLLLVQVEDLTRGGGSDLLVGPVTRLRAVPTVPGQHKNHLGKKGPEELRGLLLFKVIRVFAFYRLAFN